jgi:hypothetical protein
MRSIFTVVRVGTIEPEMVRRPSCPALRPPGGTHEQGRLDLFLPHAARTGSCRIVDCRPESRVWVSSTHTSPRFDTAGSPLKTAELAQRRERAVLCQEQKKLTLAVVTLSDHTAGENEPRRK